MHYRTVTISCLAAIVAAAGIVSLHTTRADSAPVPAVAAVSFEDVLDTPAQKSPLAPRALYNGIALAGKRLVCVGQRGLIVYSDDQGKNWIQAVVPISSDLTAVCFPSAEKGWAVGHDGVVLQTTDGGATWSKQLDGRTAAKSMADHYGLHPPAGADGVHILDDVKQAVDKSPDLPLLDVWFENETTGFIVGAFNMIFRTADGGKSWEPWLDRTENPKRFHFYAIRPVDNTLYICGEQGLVLRLNKKSGRFQSLVTPYKGTFFGIAGKPGVLLAYGMRGTVLRSRDEGRSWQKVETGIPIGVIDSTVTEDGRIILANQAGQLLVSADNGATFSPVTTGPLFPAASVVALDKDNVVLAGMRGMLKQSLIQAR